MSRRLFIAAKVAVCSGGVALIGNYRINSPFAMCKEDVEAHPTIKAPSEPIIIHDSELEDEEWELEKQKCSFCKFFLSSPCRNQFTKWSKCVDLAKAREEDFVQACAAYTKDLMNCTSANDEYFAAGREEHREGDDESDINSESDQEKEEFVEDANMINEENIVADDVMNSSTTDE